MFGGGHEARRRVAAAPPDREARLADDGTGPHGQTELDRRLVPDERDFERAHARRGDPDLRGAAARLRRLPRPRAQPPAAGAALPPEARLPADRDRQAVLGGRPALPPRLPRAALGASGAGIGGAAAQHHRTALLPGARPLQAPLGALARPGTREEPVRAGDQDPSRAGRRRLRHRHRDGPLRREAGARADRARSRLGAAAVPIVSRACGPRHGRAQRDPLQARPPRGARSQPSTAHNAARSWRPARLWARSPGTSPTRRRTYPSTRRSDPIGASPGAARSSADFKRIKDALGGTVNDVVLTVVSGALRSWLRSRGLKTEGLELRALVPVSIRAEDEHGQLGNRIAAMRGPLPGLHRGSGEAARSGQARDGRASRSPSRLSAPR